MPIFNPNLGGGTLRFDAVGTHDIAAPAVGTYSIPFSDFGFAKIPTYVQWRARLQWQSTSNAGVSGDSLGIACKMNGVTAHWAVHPTLALALGSWGPNPFVPAAATIVFNNGSIDTSVDFTYYLDMIANDSAPADPLVFDLTSLTKTGLFAGADILISATQYVA